MTYQKKPQHHKLLYSVQPRHVIFNMAVIEESLVPSSYQIVRVQNTLSPKRSRTRGVRQTKVETENA